MKLFRLLILSLFILAANAVHSQNYFLQSIKPSLDLNIGGGVSSYFGDLVQKNPYFREPSASFSAGIAYNLNPNLSFRGDFSYMQIQAHDSKNSRPDLIARNLSFKSNLWDVNALAEYNFLDMTGNNKFSPYVFAGIGFCHFNPYTIDRNGNKVFLQPLGTEGQGLPAYPNRKLYSKTVIDFPLGGGIKFAVSENVTLGLEFFYRFANTDYLDDVSNFGYPDKAALAAKNPALPQLTYRGDELPGGAPYPNPSLNRGNPNNKDSYYTGQIKIIYRLKNYNRVEVNY